MNPVPGLTIEQQAEGVLLRMLLFGEARGEQDATGRIESVAMAAVGFVVLNRSSRRKQSWREVILYPFAFSCFNRNDPNRGKLLEAPKFDPISWERADTVADLIESGLLLDASAGADHYCTATLWGRKATDGARPKWFEKPLIESGRTRETARWGHHVFALHR